LIIRHWDRSCAARHHAGVLFGADGDETPPLQRRTVFATGGMMEDVLALSAFLGAALVGLAGHVQFGGYLDDRRWLRVAAFAAAFFLMAAILGGGLPHL
jgi:hypothetical protein